MILWLILNARIHSGDIMVTLNRWSVYSLSRWVHTLDHIWAWFSTTSHKEWFSYMEKPEQLGVVAIGEDTPHPIENVGEVPLSHVGKKGKLMNVLHVPTITKNLVSFGQIVDQGMQVRFTHLGLHRGRRPSYCSRAPRWENVHPRHQWHRHRHVHKMTKSQVGYRLVA